MIKVTRHNKRKAFTLTEVAVVLGIIGLILGSIWVAASHLYQNHKVEIFTRELTSIFFSLVNQQGSLLSFSGDPGCNQSVPTTVNGVPTTTPISDIALDSTLTAEYSNVFPANMLVAPVGAAYPVSPWGGPITLMVQTATDSCGVNAAGMTPSSPGYITPAHIVNLVGLLLTMPQTACTQLLISNKKLWVQMGLYQVCTDSSANLGGCSAGVGNITPALVDTLFTSENITSWCSQGATVSVGLNFQWPPP